MFITAKKSLKFQDTPSLPSPAKRRYGERRDKETKWGYRAVPQAQQHNVYRTTVFVMLCVSAQRISSTNCYTRVREDCERIKQVAQRHYTRNTVSSCCKTIVDTVEERIRLRVKSVSQVIRAVAMVCGAYDAAPPTITRATASTLNLIELDLTCEKGKVAGNEQENLSMKLLNFRSCNKHPLPPPFLEANRKLLKCNNESFIRCDCDLHRHN